MFNTHGQGVTVQAGVFCSEQSQAVSAWEEKAAVSRLCTCRSIVISAHTGLPRRIFPWIFCLAHMGNWLCQCPVGSRPWIPWIGCVNGNDTHLVEIHSLRTYSSPSVSAFLFLTILGTNLHIQFWSSSMQCWTPECTGQGRKNGTAAMLPQHPWQMNVLIN